MRLRREALRETDMHMQTHIQEPPQEQTPVHIQGLRWQTSEWESEWAPGGLTEISKRGGEWKDTKPLCFQGSTVRRTDTTVTQQEDLIWREYEQ